MQKVCAIRPLQSPGAKELSGNIYWTCFYFTVEELRCISSLTSLRAVGREAYRIVNYIETNSIGDFVNLMTKTLGLFLQWGCRDALGVPRPSDYSTRPKHL